MQIVDMETPIHCMTWSSHHSLLALGFNSSLTLFSIHLADLAALRRCRHSEVNLDGAVTPSPVSLTERPRSHYKPDVSSRHKPILTQLGPNMTGPTHGHTGIVTAIAISQAGLVFSVSDDQTFCTFNMERPLDTFTRSGKVHSAGIVSLTHDVVNNWFVTGSFDGSFQARDCCFFYSSCFTSLGNMTLTTRSECKPFEDSWN